MYTRRQMRLRDKQCMSKSVSMQMRSKILIGYLYLTPRMFAQIVPHSKILCNFQSKCLHVCTFCAIFAPPERHICNFILFSLLIYLFLIFPSWKHNLRKINGNGLEPQLVMLKIAVRWARKGNRCKVSDLPCSSLMLKWDHHVLKFSKNQNSQTRTRCKPLQDVLIPSSGFTPQSWGETFQAEYCNCHSIKPSTDY